MKRVSRLTVAAVLVALAVIVWLAMEKSSIDARLTRQREEAEVRQRQQAGVDIAAMARRWSASTSWNHPQVITASLEEQKVETILTAAPNVVFLGRVDSIVAGPTGEKYFITLTDVDDRLLVRLNCDKGQIGKFKDAAGVERLYAMYAIVAHVTSVRKVDDLDRASGAKPLYDFTVEAQCLDELPLHFLTNTRLSEIKIPS